MEQLSYIEDISTQIGHDQSAKSGTFADNMVLPIHRWFRYSAGFSAEWVERTINGFGFDSSCNILDPFAGSGTVSLVCDKLGLKSYGIEAHPMVARVAMAKLAWSVPINDVIEFYTELIHISKTISTIKTNYPSLITRSIDDEYLRILDSFKEAWTILNDHSQAAEIVWLAITSILRSSSFAGTAQWQYILPGKQKKKVTNPNVALAQQIEVFKHDLRWMQSIRMNSLANIIIGDARLLKDIPNMTIDGVITSPPYANNYDYADALRFEMSFWGEVDGWGDLHEKVRKYLIVSSSQHSSKDRLSMEKILGEEVLLPIYNELKTRVEQLAIVRENHGGKKHYHTMVAAYCRDIGNTLKQLRNVCKPGVRMCWVIGDSAPYGIYCPIDQWIGELALAVGFKSYRFEKLRDRNIKWKNRKHRVPLKEGLLWFEG